MDGDPLAGSCLFSNGSTRAVYRVPEGRQYVLDDGGCPVYGDWLWREDDGTDFGDWYDVPIIVGPLRE